MVENADCERKIVLHKPLAAHRVELSIVLLFLFAWWLQSAGIVHPLLRSLNTLPTDRQQLEMLSSVSSPVRVD